MDAIFNQKISDEDDFYKFLGCDELSNTEQINTEYKVRARNLHPDKNPNPQAVEEFVKLQRARDVLIDETKRKEYDIWRRSGLAIPYDTWVSMKGSVHTSFHWAMKAKKEPMLEDDPERHDTGLSAHSGDSRQHYMDLPDSHESNFGWSRAPADNIVHQFRSYQI